MSFRLFQSFGKGLELSLKGVEKPITALELLRVRGASYSSFDLLLRHERESPDVDPRGSKSGGFAGLKTRAQRFTTEGQGKP